MRRRGFLAALAGAALLPACAAPRGPAAEPGAIALPEAFAGRGGALSPELSPGWWRLAGCPMLDGLVTTAEAGNPGLAEATARLAEARALEGATGQAFRPQLELSGNLGRESQTWNAARRERNQRNTVLPAARRRRPGWPLPTPRSPPPMSRRCVGCSRSSCSARARCWARPGSATASRSVP
jgi:hypothetical protein